MSCRCYELMELEGVEAEEYAREHLVKEKVDGTRWIIEYRCPQTGMHWVMDFPYGQAHGGGPPRLRRLEAC